MRYLIIENRPTRAAFYDLNGVDIIFVDLEQLGKQERQVQMDSVKSKHSVEDVYNVRKILTNAELLVRIDPINPNTSTQIEEVIAAGADTIMLPYFSTDSEVENFIELVDGRVKTCLLVETAAAVLRLPEILEVKGIDRVHIGLNDLSLDMKINFMFELLTTPYFDHIINQLKDSNIPFGIGGVAPPYEGLIPGEMILMEYFKLGADYTILSRPFTRKMDVSESEFLKSFSELKEIEKQLATKSNNDLNSNSAQIKSIIKNRF